MPVMRPTKAGREDSRSCAAQHPSLGTSPELGAQARSSKQALHLFGHFVVHAQKPQDAQCLAQLEVMKCWLREAEGVHHQGRGVDWVRMVGDLPGIETLLPSNNAFVQGNRCFALTSIF